MTFEFQCSPSSIRSQILDDPAKVCADVPLPTLVPRCNKKQLQSLAVLHGIQWSHRNTVSELRTVLEDHNCDCPRLISVFHVQTGVAILAAKAEQKRNKRQADRSTVRVKSSDAARKYRKARASSNKRPAISERSFVPFPPEPASRSLRHEIVSGMCNEFTPESFEEVGCAVCGQLVKRSEATPRNDIMVDFDLLIRDDVTRRPRTCEDDPVEDLDGPILDENCTHVCVKCEKALRKKTVPNFALANHLWIGSVPPELSALTFAEKILISKVRHNRCVVRVASGRGKLIGNVIMFESPIAKVY
ncbi:hypothetical protein B0H12DRAFT_1014588, partial [Mycena haematopus]